MQVRDDSQQLTFYRKEAEPRSLLTVVEMAVETALKLFVVTDKKYLLMHCEFT